LVVIRLNTYIRIQIKPMDLLNKRIIIFDDDEDILSICSFVLQESGWEVFVFPDCKDVVERVSEIAPAAIVMDNWIPETGGIIATQLLKQTAAVKDIPVIYFSANSKIEDLAAEAGADDYLAKPFELEDLEQIVLKNVTANTTAS
jgi:DNA-binding response OmpR family regulator